MPLTISDVVGLPVLQRGEPEILSDRRWDDEIRWIHVSDVADLSTLPNTIRPSSIEACR